MKTETINDETLSSEILQKIVFVITVQTANFMSEIIMKKELLRRAAPVGLPLTHDIRQPSD